MPLEETEKSAPSRATRVVNALDDGNGIAAEFQPAASKG